MVNGLVNEILGQSDAGVSSAMFYLKSKLSRCYVDQQIGPTLSS